MQRVRSSGFSGRFVAGAGAGSSGAVESLFGQASPSPSSQSTGRSTWRSGSCPAPPLSTCGKRGSGGLRSPVSTHSGIGDSSDGGEEAEDDEGEEDPQFDFVSRAENEIEEEGGDASEDDAQVTLARETRAEPVGQLSIPPSPASSRPATGLGSAVVHLPAMSPASRRGGSVIKCLASRARLRVAIVTQFDGPEVAVELTEGEADGGQVQALPKTLKTNEIQTMRFRSASSVVGILRISGAPPVQFAVQVGAMKPNGERQNFVGSEGRDRTTVADAGQLDTSHGPHAKGEGTAVEISITSGAFAEMQVLVRRAKKKELTRIGQRRALEAAMEKKNYSSLIAQITKSKMRKVELAFIEQASQLLKSLKPPTGSFLTHAQLQKSMKWKRVTGMVTPEYVLEPCTASDSCPCNNDFAQIGEVCGVTDGVVDEALGDVVPDGTPGDKWLFKALVKAAIAAPEGCVWKSGGKFLLTNEERNQSANGIVSVLERGDQNSDAGKAIRALIAYTERKYKYSVTAVQLNLHPNEKSSHRQHRDIYGAGVKAGVNCTCSFMKCVGTVCFSLGSSRQVLTQTMTDSRSKYTACGEECVGCKKSIWMHSGSAMFFNDKWNNNHTHGVPELDEQCGPRISVALLCAPGPGGGDSGALDG
eukprot:TRINITY_DN49126_c0_g1_i1.p1 TRINITY_DN49126_c0_g1~~TRINITY_DN49126_c0_g1_i1.p1  ORF type:complete len:646 (+),score=93.11 TRINITY_DN49126_c0_g1_i1:21-1958(+)